MHIIIGLGNPGKEYENTRHNAGRMAVERIHATHNFSEWHEEKKPKMLTALGAISGGKSTLVLPNTFMNKSGQVAGHFIHNKKGAGNVIVLHDDMDIPIGSFKLSFGRGSGGHNGVESVIRALKTKDFVRVRIGVAPKTPKGMAKKPVGEEKVLKFLLGKFSSDNLVELKKVFKQVIEAVEVTVTDGHQVAMNHHN